MKTERDGRVVAVRPVAPPAGATNGHSSAAESAANGLAAMVVSSPSSSAPSAPNSGRMEHFTRGPTSSGGRNMQDTTFSLSAEYPSTHISMILLLKL